jgi:hypothetical protein
MKLATALPAVLTIISTVISAVATGVVAWFTVVLADVGKRQIADTRILQRAYLSVEPKGIEWSNNALLVGQVAFKNVGKLPATEFVSVVKKVEVRNAEWATPNLTDGDLPAGITGVIPIGAEAPQGSEGITPVEVTQAPVTGEKFLYVWGRAKFKDGFNIDRHVNFCHRYPLSTKRTEPQGPGYSISPKFSRHHEHGNKSD